MHRTTLSALSLLTAAALAGCNSNTAPGNDQEAASEPDQPPAKLAPAAEAIDKADIARADPEIMTAEEYRSVVGEGAHCSFSYTRIGHPIFVVSHAGGDAPARGVAKVHGKLVALDAVGSTGAVKTGGPHMGADGIDLSVEFEDGSRDETPREATLRFHLDRGLTAHYNGFYSC